MNSDRATHHQVGGERVSVSRALKRAMKLASDSDRAWFASNPQRTHRGRLAFADEVPGGTFPPSKNVWVVVRQVKPGYRLRQPCTVPGALPDVEPLLHALFDLIREAAAAGDGSTLPRVSKDALFQRAMAMAHAGQA